MSQDMVVTAPAVPSVSTDPTMSAVGYTSGSIVGGPPPWAARAIDLDTSAFYDRTIVALAKILRSTKTETNKLADSLDWFRSCVLLNDCKLDDPHNSLIYVNRYDARDSYSINDSKPQLSNSPYSIVSALANFLWGNARTMSVDISFLSLQFIQPGNIPGFNERMNTIGEPGFHNLTIAFPYDTAGSSLTMPYILGNITLQLDGNFTRNASGSWSFDGVVRAQVPDLYDFNASTHRTKTNEDLTTIGRWMGEHFQGQPYKIEINGETRVKF